MTVEPQTPTPPRVEIAPADLVVPPGSVPPQPRHRIGWRPSRPWRRRFLVAAVVLALVIGVGLRLWTRSQLWLDEAQGVAIAHAPLDHLVTGLKHDGSPPAYYVLLHFWMRLFGSGDVAVRALSSVFSVLCLPAMWLLGRRVIGSRAGAWTALLLLASFPYAIRYSTEARMYSLVILLTILGGLAISWCWRRDGWLPVAAVAAATAALLYTHYWSMYLLGPLAVGLAFLGWRRGSASGRRALVGVVIGGMAFLPWLPVFLYQSAHTGTPWAHAPKPGDLLNIMSGWAGGELQKEPFLTLLYWLVAIVGWGGRAGGRWNVSVDLRGRSPGRWLFALTFVSLLVAFIAGDVAGVAFLTRYTAAVAVPFILLLTVGVRRLPKGRPLLGTTTLLVVLGLAAGAVVADTQRSESAQIAADIKALASPGDVVVACPDQLGPALSRYLAGVPVTMSVFPTGNRGTTVDWVGYADRNETASPDVFALSAIRRAQGHGLWLVYADGYRTFGRSCGQIRADFEQFRAPPGSGAVGQVIDHAHTRELEHANLVWWAKPTS